ncbi:MAG: polyprenyl synthetase family protein [Bacteroidetes bacterium]|nr:polyprenyl synthetase family protein [Bacteroidota bacterium]
MSVPAVFMSQSTIPILQQEINEALGALRLAERAPRRLYAPAAYLLELPAKRTRPLLCLLAYRAWQPDHTSCMPAALALELFHNFTLVHDDIMDNAPTRRGQPTVHARWDSSTAILAGDALYAYTQQLLVQAFPQQAAALIRCYSQAALEVCEGQMRDMELAAAEAATLADYMAMIEQKTAALIGGSLCIGALAAQAPPGAPEALDRYGRLMGIAFQLLDDLLDVYAEADKFGKQPGGDIIENKKTYLWLRAHELADPAQLQALQYWASVQDQPEAKVAAVRALYDNLDLPTRTRDLIVDYRRQAEARLQPLLPNPALQILHEYLSEVLTRAY